MKVLLTLSVQMEIESLNEKAYEKKKEKIVGKFEKGD